MFPVRPKKKLGQHFLTDKNIAVAIVNSLINENNYSVVEVGAGTGVLTDLLLNRFGTQLTALDVDKQSIAFLKNTFPTQTAQILDRDFLQYPLNKPTCIIGNFPYHLSSSIFFKVWETNEQVDEVVCMVQKEVGDRICASFGSKTYGILSVLLQVFYTTESLFDVSPEVFLPPPKVLSTVIRLKRKSNPVDMVDIKALKRVTKFAFGQRRKTLRNALKTLNLSKELNDLEVMSKRAEQLSPLDFIALTKKIIKDGV